MRRPGTQCVDLENLVGTLVRNYDGFMGVKWFFKYQRYGDGSIPINTIFSGMNIHSPAVLMFTRGTRF